jgi:hypothetical protein
MDDLWKGQSVPGCQSDALSLLCSKAPFCFTCGPRSLIVQHEIWICSNRGDRQSITARSSSWLCSQRAMGLILLPDTIRVGRIRDEEEYDGVRVFAC